MRNKILFAVVLMVSIITVSCQKPAPVSPKSAYKSITVDVDSSWITWNYISLKDAKLIGKGKIGADDAAWKARTDWDIAFSRLYAKTNSGTSGDGKGGVIEVGTHEPDKDKVFAELMNVAEGGYIVDVISPEPGLLVSDDVSIKLVASTSLEINKWLKSAVPIEVYPKVFSLKTGDGKYAKIYLKRDKDENNNSGRIIMEYIYQPDGSTNVSGK